MLISPLLTISYSRLLPISRILVFGVEFSSNSEGVSRGFLFFEKPAFMGVYFQLIINSQKLGVYRSLCLVILQVAKKC